MCAKSNIIRVFINRTIVHAVSKIFESVRRMLNVHRY